MGEEERIEIPDETTDVDAPQEKEAGAAPETDTDPEAAAVAEISGGPEGEAAAETPEGETAAHGLSGATMETLTRTDEQSLAAAEAERTQWERMREDVKGRILAAYYNYIDDGGFKLCISLVTAVIAACIIVISGIFSERLISVVFWRALVGFCASGLFMGAVLYWLDQVGIPLFISRHEEQMQSEWVSEAEEPTEAEGESPAAEEEPEPGEMQELMPQEGAEGAEEAAGTSEESPEAGAEAAAPGEEPQPGTEGPKAEAGQEEEPGQETPEGEKPADEEMDGLENAVLDDAFASEETEEEENQEPPSFSPMTADNLESLSVPEG